MMAFPLENIPTPKAERWKYTNLPRALKGMTLNSAALGWGAANVALLNPDAPGAAVYGDTTLWDMNAADLTDIRFVTGNEDISITAQDGQYLSPRLIVQAKDNQEITIVERQGGQGAYFKNQVVQIVAENNSRIRHYRLFDESAKGVCTIFTHVKIGRDARYEAFTLIEGQGTIRNQIHAEIQGANAHCGLGGINLLNGASHADTTITIEHQAPHCSSNQTYKSVLDGESHCVFQGKVHVHQAAQKTDGYQLSNALLLSPTAEMDTKPELEIYADDVKCSHGATTGMLDDSALFYLRARGIPEAAARALLVNAFCAQALDVIGDEGLRDAIEGKIARWLNIQA